MFSGFIVEKFSPGTSQWHPVALCRNWASVKQYVAQRQKIDRRSVFRSAEVKNDQRFAKLGDAESICVIVRAWQDDDALLPRRYETKKKDERPRERRPHPASSFYSSRGS